MKNYILVFLMINVLVVISVQLRASTTISPILKGGAVVNASFLDTLKTNAKDPVCGMPVKKGSTLTVLHKDKVYGFCTKSCKISFLKQPEKYVKVDTRK